MMVLYWRYLIGLRQGTVNRYDPGQAIQPLYLICKVEEILYLAFIVQCRGMDPMGSCM